MNDKLEPNEVEIIIEKALNDLPKGRMTSLEYLDWSFFLTALTEVVQRCQDNSKLVLLLNRLEFALKVRGIVYFTTNNKYGISFTAIKGLTNEDS